MFSTSRLSNSARWRINESFCGRIKISTLCVILDDCLFFNAPKCTTLGTMQRFTYWPRRPKTPGNLQRDEKHPLVIRDVWEVPPPSCSNLRSGIAFSATRETTVMSVWTWRNLAHSKTIQDRWRNLLPACTKIDTLKNTGRFTTISNIIQVNAT